MRRPPAVSLASSATSASPAALGRPLWWRALRAAAASAAVVALSGCGPTLSTYLIVSAQAELDGAKAAEADKYAVYEYVAASEYLHKAREEQGYADYGPSIDFAFKAQELARKGTERASKEKSVADPSVDGASTDGTATASPEPGDAEPARVKVVPIPVDEGTKAP